MESEDARKYLERALPARQWRAASQALARDPSYINHHIRRGSPRFLNERDREILVALYDLNPEKLKPPAKKPLLVVFDQSVIDSNDKTEIDALDARERANRACRAQIRRACLRIESHEKLTAILGMILVMAEQPAVSRPTKNDGPVENVALLS
jgi:hypothetical protein